MMWHCLRLLVWMYLHIARDVQRTLAVPLTYIHDVYVIYNIIDYDDFVLGE